MISIYGINVHVFYNWIKLVLTLKHLTSTYFVCISRKKYGLKVILVSVGVIISHLTMDIILSIDD